MVCTGENIITLSYDLADTNSIILELDDENGCLWFIPDNDKNISIIIRKYDDYFKLTSNTQLESTYSHGNDSTFLL